VIQVVENVAVCEVDLYQRCLDLIVILRKADNEINQHFIGQSEVAFDFDSVVKIAAFFFDQIYEIRFHLFNPLLEKLASTR
jgi:hypothetical protein